jgi:hypothetical protein
MEAMTVAELIRALEMVGRIYRNKDGSQPAEAVRKVIGQLDGAGDLTLDEWARAKSAKPAAKSLRAIKAKMSNAEERIREVADFLRAAKSQAELRDAMSRISLAADDWRALAKSVTGISAKTGKAAREAVETHFSDGLLIDERLEAVKQQFLLPPQLPSV